MVALWALWAHVRTHGGGAVMPALHVQCAASIPLLVVALAAAAGCGVALLVLMLAGLALWWAAPRVRCYLGQE